jgi:hypothetical protein
MAVHDELEVTTEQRMEAVRHPDMSVQHGLPQCHVEERDCAVGHRCWRDRVAC